MRNCASCSRIRGNLLRDHAEGQKPCIEGRQGVYMFHRVSTQTGCAIVPGPARSLPTLTAAIAKRGADILSVLKEALSAEGNISMVINVAEVVT